MDRKTPVRGHTGTHALHFNDEAGAIGSGRRLVNIKVGSKWVSVRCASTGRGVRMHRSQFIQVWQGTVRRRERAAKAKGGVAGKHTK